MTKQARFILSHLIFNEKSQNKNVFSLFFKMHRIVKCSGLSFAVPIQLRVVNYSVIYQTEVSMR